jgi:hypothetical protein
MVIDMIYRNEPKPQKRPHVACTMMRFCSGADILVCLLSMSLQIIDVDYRLLSILTSQSIGKLHLRFSTYDSIGST